MGVTLPPPVSPFNPESLRLHQRSLSNTVTTVLREREWGIAVRLGGAPGET
jgi:hypothetical protein